MADTNGNPKRLKGVPSFGRRTMNPTAISETPSLEAAQALARHLRENPSAASRTAADLANSFSLEPSFVEDVLRGVAKPAKQITKRDKPKIGKIIEGSILKGFDFITINPPVFVAILSAIYFTVLAQQLIPFISSIQHLTDAQQTAEFIKFRNANGWWVPVFGVMLGLQMACFYRYGQVRQALYGALVFWMVTASVNVFIMWATAVDRTNPALVGKFFAAILALLIFGTMYAALGSLFAVLGGYAKFRREDKAEDSMSRQQMLERLFEVQSRLKTCQTLDRREKHFLPESWSALFNKHPYLTVIGGNVLLSALWMLSAHYSGVTFNTHAEPALLAVIVQVAFLMAVILFMTGISYLAGGFRRAVWLLALAHIVAFPANLINFAPFGPDAYPILFSKARMIMDVLMLLGLAGLGSLSSVVEQRTLRANRLRDSDPAALLAEMVRLEWRLKIGTTNVCVVVVDAAKSAEMKANSDPLVAEYSFREYQNFLATICNQNEGNVYSTAGDGAILAFAKCENALTAAREIQTGISYFNEHVNRMSAKFRLRIGLHMGPITGSLQEVQFTEVIDIAAHVQGAAPVRGILMTKSVAECLPEEHLIPLKEPVDGCEVYLAYNPTVDA